jgi:transcriptional regulator with XRE-family HTH domain
MKIILTLKQYRELLKYNQKDVADSIQLTQSSYSQIESGYRVGTPDNYQKIADFFGIKMEDVMYDHIPVFIYVYNKKNELEDDEFKHEIETVLNEISEKIKMLKKKNNLL